MPTFRRIPDAIKKRNIATARGRWVVFAPIKKAVAVLDHLDAFAKKINDIPPEDDPPNLPAFGSLTFKGEKFFYCGFGFFDDPDAYAAPMKKSKSGFLIPSRRKASGNEFSLFAMLKQFVRLGPEVATSIEQPVKAPRKAGVKKSGTAKLLKIKSLTK